MKRVGELSCSSEEARICQGRRARKRRHSQLLNPNTPFIRTVTSIAFRSGTLLNQQSRYAGLLSWLGWTSSHSGCSAGLRQFDTDVWSHP